MNWVERELALARPLDPRDAWLRLEPEAQCAHRFRLLTVYESQRAFHRLGFRSICEKCEAEA